MKQLARRLPIDEEKYRLAREALNTNAKDFTKPCPAAQAAGRTIPAQQIVLDGEIGGRYAELLGNCFQDSLLRRG